MSVVCDRACRAQLLKFWSKVMLYSSSMEETFYGASINHRSSAWPPVSQLVRVRKNPRASPTRCDVSIRRVSRREAASDQSERCAVCRPTQHCFLLALPSALLNKQVHKCRRHDYRPRGATAAMPTAGTSLGSSKTNQAIHQVHTDAPSPSFSGIRR